MANIQVIHICDCGGINCPSRTGLNRRIDLDILYTDQKQSIKLQEGLSCPVTITVRTVIKDFLEFAFVDDIPPEDIRLTGLGFNRQRLPVNISETRTTLQDLRLTDGYTLYLEPSPNAPPLKLCHLTICGPDESTKKDFPWYKAKTTLGMLYRYIIEEFSLQMIKPEHIHLFTLFQELNVLADSDVRLSEFNIHDRMSIHINIFQANSSPIVDKSLNVHVECTSDDDKFVLEVPNTETIGGLRHKIEKHFKDRRVTDFKLCNEANEEIHLSDSDRTLKSFGIKPDQTIFATLHFGASNTDPPLENSHTKTQSSSLSTKHTDDKVTVVCSLPSHNPETIQVSVKDTVDELIKKINSHLKNRRLVPSAIWAGTIEIDIKQLERCLADFGVTSKDTIQVTMIDKNPVHTSIVSTRSPSSPKADKSSKTKRANLKPIGLINLGNTCYMSSAFQCLAHVPPLTDFFLNNSEHKGDDWESFNEVGEVTGAYAELLWNLWRRDEDDYSFKPTYIQEKIGEMDSRFATKDQQDAQEFMTFLLNAIHKELKSKNKNDKNTIIKQLFFGEIQSTITCTECHQEEATKSPISFLSIPLNRQERAFWVKFILKDGGDETEFIDMPMSGRVEHLVARFARRRHDNLLYNYILPMAPDGELDYKTPLSELTHDEVIFFEQEDYINHAQPEQLAVPTKKSTLDNCLEDFLSSEELEDGWFCQAGCKKKSKAIKRLNFSTLPSVLIIQFKRFSHENGLHQKIETFVDYPTEGLRIANLSSSEKTVYDLIAVSNHMGSISGGHYTACVRRTIKGKDEWFKFDDSVVSSIHYDDEIISRDAYLLFYIKRDILNKVVTTVV